MNTRWLLVIFSVVLSACSSAPDKPQELTEREYYEQAQESLDNNSYMVAIERLNQLESRYPFGRYAEQAQLELIYAYYQTSDLENVLANAERFIRLHPLHEQVDYAYYLRGLATYEMSYTFAERYMDTPVAKRDPTPMHDAFNYFSELLQRFPDSPYTGDARARMIYLRERMATHEIGVAQYYMKRHAYLAAANRCEDVLLHYQKTPAVADALAILVETYRLLGMNDEASQSLALLTLNYPDHPQLQDGEFTDSGLTVVDRRSFWNIITFGLLDKTETSSVSAAE